MVEFQTQCFTLHEEAGCQQYKSNIGRPVILAINPTTNGLTCATEDLTILCADKCCEGVNGVIPPGHVCERPNTTKPTFRPRPSQAPTQAAPRPQQPPLRPDPASNSQLFTPPSQDTITSGQPQAFRPQGSTSSQQVPTGFVQPNVQFQRPPSPTQQLQAPVQSTPLQTQQQTQQGSGQSQSQFQAQGQQSQIQSQGQQSQLQSQGQQSQGPTKGQEVHQQIEEVIQNSQVKPGPQPLTDAQKLGQRILNDNRNYK